LVSRPRLPLLLLVLAAAGAHASACDGSGEADDGNMDGGTGSPTHPETGVGLDDATVPAATMRLAHVAPDLGPVDFCYRTATTTSFEGPVLSQGIGGPRADAGDAGEAGDDDAGEPVEAGDDGGGPDDGAPSVAYRTVSRYITLGAAGPLTIALVAPGSSSCASPIFSADVTLDPGKLATVAILGQRDADSGDATLGLAGFVDDRTTTSDKSRVRIVHAAFGTGARAPSSAIAVRAVGAKTVPLAERVEPRRASSASSTVPVDSLGYATITPVPSPAQLAVGPAPETSPDGAAESWLSQGVDLGLRGASLHTGFVLTGGDQPFEVLWCADTSTTGDRTTCQLVR
jgi:hypothetical protein